MAIEFKKLPKVIQKRMKQYRKELLIFGMDEPGEQKLSLGEWRFYKPMTDLTAFVVNLQGSEHGVEVTYGYASTAFTLMAGNESYLVVYGVSDEDITIREKALIFNEADEATAKGKIQEMHAAYKYTQKDELLLLAKEKRKAFIQQIHTRLKPLGFKKKANTWKRSLTDTYYLMFNAQKSSFSDQYYFNIYIGKNGTDLYGECYYSRIAPQNMFPADWQTIEKEKLDLFFDEAMVPELEKVIYTPLSELGRIPYYWTGCCCDRKKCENCWIQKNMWEAK